MQKIAVAMVLYPFLVCDLIALVRFSQRCKEISWSIVVVAGVLERANASERLVCLSCLNDTLSLDRWLDRNDGPPISICVSWSMMWLIVIECQVVALSSPLEVILFTVVENQNWLQPYDGQNRNIVVLIKYDKISSVFRSFQYCANSDLMIETFDFIR